jgi:ferredoxin
MSRRQLLSGFLKPGYWSDRRRRSRAADLPAGVDILLDQNRCTAWGRGICNDCESACPEQALYFVGMMNPRVLHNRCTLCGDCVPVCPEDAIVVRPPAEDEPERKG